MSVVLVSGSNSIAKAITDTLSNKYIIYNINARNKSYKVLERYIRDIVDKYDNISALINTDGYNILSPFEELDIRELKRVFEINLFNNIRLMKLVLPIMKRQMYGKIINIVSIAGRVGFPMVSPYSSAEFALEGVSESIMYELEKYNIKVILVEIGAVKNYLKVIAKKSNDKNYSALLDKMSKGLKILLEHGTDPEEIAKLILKILESKEPQFRYSIGNDVSMLLEAKSNLNEREFERFMKEEILPQD